MIKNLNKVIVIIILMIFCISFLNKNSYALVDADRATLRKGDKLKIIKDSYEYKDKSGMWYKDFQQDKKGLHLKKGEIVEFLGGNENITSDASVAGKTKFFYKVKRQNDNKSFWMIQENLEKYQVKAVERPATLDAFIKKYGMSSSLSDKDYNEKYKNYRNKAIAENNYADDIISSNKTGVDAIVNSSKKTVKVKKEELEKLYKAYSKSNSVDYIPQTVEDYCFIAISYYLSRKYVTIEKIEEMNNENESWADRFDNAYDIYNKTSSASEKDAAMQTMKDAMDNMSNSEKEERKSKYEEVQEKERDRAEANHDETEGEVDVIYKYPENNQDTSAGSLDDMMGDADKFINSAGEAAISATSLQKFSQTYYNILLTVGIVVAAIVGSILGIKFMMSGAEGKAQIKELLVPYIVGCIVVFGAFAIWKLLVTILSGM